MIGWMRGTFIGARVDVPLRFITGLKDPVITPTPHRGYETWASDVGFETVPGSSAATEGGHFPAPGEVTLRPPKSLRSCRPPGWAAATGPTAPA